MIDLHGLAPCLRREAQRSKRLLLWVSSVAVVALLVTPFLHGALVVVPAGFAVLGAILLWFAPVGHLVSDRVLGHLESDRALPIAFRVMAAGRLLGASVATLPLLPAIAALLLAVSAMSGDTGFGGLGVLIVIPVALQLLAMVALWWLLAINARWSLRRLWWLIPTVGFVPQAALFLFPERVTDAFQSQVLALASQLVATAAGPGGILLLGVLAAMLLCVSFSGAAMLYASGLQRYRFDPTQLGIPLARAPRRELLAMHRGPLLAVTRLRLRVATEQFRREVLVLGLGLLLAAFGPPALREFARSYVPILATLLPAGIAFQLFTARSTGDLVGMQQLPVSGTTVALGHLLAVAVLALPGAVALQLLRELHGGGFSALELAGSWGWLVTAAWLSAAIGLWFKPRYALLLMIALWGALAAVVMLTGDGALHSMVRGVRESPRLLGGGLPLAAAAVSAALGVPLFARALARYTPRTGVTEPLYQFQKRVGRT